MEGAGRWKEQGQGQYQVYKGQEHWQRRGQRRRQGPGPGVGAVGGAVELAAAVVVCMAVIGEVLLCSDTMNF